MATKLGKILADFTTTLSAALAVGATSATLQSATDDDGVALPTGTYYFTIDPGNSSKEHIQCSLNGTALTSIYSCSRQGTLTSGVARAHRLGATVVLTDFAHLLFIRDLLAGTTDLNASVPLKYDGAATINNDYMLATKAYVDGVAVAGAPDASTTVKGLVELATTAETNAGTGTGGTGAALVATPATLAASIYGLQLPSSGQKDALAATTTPASTNLYVTQKDMQKGAELYAADSVGTDSYAITLSPAPAALVTGMVFRFKAGTANTGACTLNVNSLGATSIKKAYNTDLATGDILQNQIVEVMYDGTNFQMMSQTAVSASTAAYAVARGTISDNSSVTTSSGGGTNTDTVVTHGLGTTPKLVILSAKITAAGTTNQSVVQGVVMYDSSGNIAGASWNGWNSNGSLAISNWLYSTNSNMTAQGVGGNKDTITISIISIGATDFTFRINGANSGSSGGTSTVNSIVWTAMG